MSGGSVGGGKHGVPRVDRRVTGDPSNWTITPKVDSSLAKCLDIDVDHVEVNLHGW